MRFPGSARSAEGRIRHGEHDKNRVRCLAFYRENMKLKRSAGNNWRLGFQPDSALQQSMPKPG
jgi:hypothetical protein